MVSLREIVTHTIGIVIIGSYVYLLLASASDSTIIIPEKLSTMALIIIGFYFGYGYEHRRRDNTQNNQNI